MDYPDRDTESLKVFGWGDCSFSAASKSNCRWYAGAMVEAYFYVVSKETTNWFGADFPQIAIFSHIQQVRYK